MLGSLFNELNGHDIFGSFGSRHFEPHIEFPSVFARPARLNVLLFCALDKRLFQYHVILVRDPQQPIKEHGVMPAYWMRGVQNIVKQLPVLYDGLIAIG